MPAPSPPNRGAQATSPPPLAGPREERVAPTVELGGRRRLPGPLGTWAAGREEAEPERLGGLGPGIPRGSNRAALLPLRRKTSGHRFCAEVSPAPSLWPPAGMEPRHHDPQSPDHRDDCARKD